AALGKLAPIGVKPTGHALGEKILVDVPTLEVEVLEGLARKIVEATNAPAFILLGQTSADVYVVEELSTPGVTRRLEFSRDSEPQWTLTGAPCSWEADLHFALPPGELVDALADFDW